MKDSKSSIIPKGILEMIRKSHEKSIRRFIPKYSDDFVYDYREERIEYKPSLMSLKVCALCKNSHTLSLSNVSCTILGKKVGYNYTCKEFKHNSQMNPSWEAKLKMQIITNNNKNG